MSHPDDELDEDEEGEEGGVARLPGPALWPLPASRSSVLELTVGDTPLALAVRDESSTGPPCTRLYVAGQLVGGLRPSPVSRSRTAVLDAAGRRLGSIVLHSSPGVRLMWVFSRQPRPHLVCRATRALLPPSNTWLFAPRCHTHDRGGWYLEWEGHERSDRPGGLHPAIHVLAAALDSLDAEARRQARSEMVASWTNWVRRPFRSSAKSESAAPAKGGAAE